MKKINVKSILIKLAIVVGLVAVDLITKKLAQVYLQGSDTIVLIPNFLELSFVKNSGASFGMMSDKTLILTIFSGVFIVGIIVYDYFFGDNNKLYISAFVLILAGAIGNFVERVVAMHEVTDFIGMFNWYVCNIADIFICVGIALYVLYCILDILSKRKTKDAKDNS